MVQGAVILMLIGYVALYILLSVGLGAVQATIIVLTKRRHLEARGNNRADAWRRNIPPILSWIVPQVLALCLSACLVPTLLAVWISQFRSGGVTAPAASLPLVLFTGGMFLALALTLTVEYVLVWLIRRPLLVFLLVVPLPLLLLPALALLALLGVL